MSLIIYNKIVFIGSEYPRNAEIRAGNKTHCAGPVIISPHGIIPALYREMILKRPQEFKIAALEAIRDLFPDEWNPFYAGFGNRDTDEISYLQVGVPASRIFTINHKGMFSSSTWVLQIRQDTCDKHDQCFFFSRNIGKVVPKNSCFYCKELYVQDQSFLEIMFLSILETKSLPEDGMEHPASNDSKRCRQ